MGVGKDTNLFHQPRLPSYPGPEVAGVTGLSLTEGSKRKSQPVLPVKMSFLLSLLLSLLLPGEHLASREISPSSADKDWGKTGVNIRPLQTQ